MNLLIVDANLAERLATRRLLEDSCAVREAGSGREALAAQDAETSCLLLETTLPDMDCIDFLVQLRTLNLDLAVVLLCHSASEDFLARARDCGADDIQIKGVSADALLRSIRGAIKRRALDISLRREQARPELIYRLIDESSDLFFALGSNGEIVETNLAAEQALGFSRQDLVGSRLNNHPLFDRIGSRLLERLRETVLNESVRIDGELVMPDGSMLPVEINSMRVRVSNQDFLVAVARNISERRALEEHLRRLSLNDALTGIANRRAFEARLAEEWRRAGRSGAPLSLLLIDVDHFKAYNDTLGHLAGDEALRTVATRLQAALRRPEDLLARYGGEEFAVLLPATNTAGATLFAHHLLSSLHRAALPHPASPTAEHVTVSIGGSSTERFAERSASALIASADAALYRAKAGGRDRVEFNSL
ncbi:MAG: diguanylate cyclase [Stagnimonas sp.]|nr:diguanylate cyclase [Stagnimonas sp.]